MRLKLGLLICGVLLVFALLTHFYIVGTLEADSQNKLEQSLIHGYTTYVNGQRATREQRLDIVRQFAKEPEVVNTVAMPAETPEQAEERHFKLFEKLEVLSRLKYFADQFVVVDAEGVELGRTLVAKWRKNRYGDFPVVKAALAGTPGEDIWMFENKIMMVDVVPVVKEDKVIGAMISANSFDEDLIKQERSIAMGELAFFSKDRVIVSSLSSARHVALHKFVQQNGSKIAQVLLSKNDYFEEKLELVDEDYLVILSPIATVPGQGLVGFMLLRSETHWLDEFFGARKFLLIFTILLIMLGISGSFVIIQKAYDTVDFVLEGAHQIIVGNKDYQFSSDDLFLNQVGQTLNLMIAILIGKYIPEDEEEAERATVRGVLDSAKPKAADKGSMLIETMDEGDQSEAADSGAESEDQYYERIFKEFVQAKQQVGEDVSMITKDKLIAKLERTEQKLVARHGCKRVVFNVRIEHNKVTLKPSPIWK